jgi:hypothetical protein
VSGAKLRIKRMGVMTTRQVLNWMTEFIDTLYTRLVTATNTVLLIIYALYKSLGYIKPSQSSLVVSWQRIYNRLSFNFSVHNIFKSHAKFLSCHIVSIIRLPSPEAFSVQFLCLHAHILAVWCLETHLTQMSKSKSHCD